MKPPGARRRALATRVLDPSRMERLVDPAIADMQHEHEEATRQGLIWRRRWIALVGYVAVVTVTAVATIDRALHGRSRDEDCAVKRTMVLSSIVTLILTLVLLSAPLSNTVWRHSGHRLSMVISLIPQGLSVAMPFGLLFGIILGLHERAASSGVQSTIAGLAVVCSVAAFVILAWVLPAANQTFRELAFGGPLQRGMNEMTLSELASRHRTAAAFGLHEEGILFGATYQLRFALAFAPTVLGLFALGVARAQRRARGRFAMGVIALAISFAYYTLVYGVRPVALMGEQLPPATVWLPDLVFLAVALLMFCLPFPEREKCL